jgi:hypothetical protein
MYRNDAEKRMYVEIAQLRRTNAEFAEVNENLRAKVAAVEAQYYESRTESYAEGRGIATDVTALAAFLVALGALIAAAIHLSNCAYPQFATSACVFVGCVLLVRRILGGAWWW